MAPDKPQPSGELLPAMLAAGLVAPWTTVPNLIWRLPVRLLKRLAYALATIPWAAATVWLVVVEATAKLPADHAGPRLLESWTLLGRWLSHTLIPEHPANMAGFWLTLYIAAVWILLIIPVGIAIVSTVAFGPLHVWRITRPEKKQTSHGSAEWGTTEQAQKAGALAPKAQAGGVMLGRFEQGVPGKLDPRYRVKSHVLTCAPTGTGKGIGCVIPNLLDYPGSVVCLDVKGENYAVTANRRRELGQAVHVIDPFGITDAEGASVNWLDSIDITNENCISNASKLADMLVVRDGGAESHWDDMAADLLRGLLLHVAQLPDEQRHAGTLRQILTLPQTELVALLEELGADTEVGFGVVSAAANMFLGKAQREQSGILSTAQRHTAFLDDPQIKRALLCSDIDWKSLKENPQTIYIALPPDKLGAYSRFARAVIGLGLQELLTPGQPEYDVLFILDEVAQLGHFKAIEDGVSIFRGYGIRLWLLVQDLSQLQAVYPKWRTFLANTVLQAFGTQDRDTAKYVAEILGTETIEVHSQNSSSSSSSSGSSSSSSTGTQNHGRALLMPDEVRRLKSTTVLVFEQGVPPYRLRRLNYRVDRDFAGKFQDNPLYERIG